MSYNYMFQGYQASAHARALGLGLPISTKKSVEICNRVRGKDLAKAKGYLARVLTMDQPVAYTRFNRGGTGHKPGMAGARYPIKTAKAILQLLEAAQANAEHKGLNPQSLAIIHIAAQKDGKQWHYGRKRRRAMKRTTIEIVVAERAAKQEKRAPRAQKETKPVHEKKHEKDAQ